MDDQDVVVALEYEAAANNLVTVVPAARQHPLVTQIERSYRQAKPDKYGMLTPGNRIRLVIRSSPGCLSRTLGIVNAICHACDTRGWPLRIESLSPPPYAAVTVAALIVRVLGHDIHVALAEASRRQLRPPQPKASRSWRPSSGSVDSDASSTPPYSYDLFEYIPTGSLTLEIRTWAAIVGSRKWSDSPRGKVEEKLHELFKSLIRIAGVKRAESATAEQKRREREAAWRRHEEREHAEQFQKLLGQELLQEAENWTKVQRLTTYVDAVREAHISSGGSIDPKSEMGRWLAWADQYIRSLDCRLEPKRDPASVPPIARRPVPGSWR